MLPYVFSSRNIPNRRTDAPHGFLGLQFVNAVGAEGCHVDNGKVNSDDM
jgi:hypothetical protein